MFQQQQRPPPPPVPQQPSFMQSQPIGFLAGGGSSFQQPTPQHSASALLNPNQQRFLSPSPGFNGATAAPLVSQPTGWAPTGTGGAMVTQATGYVSDPRMQIMSRTFMPANPSTPYGPGGSTPQFGQAVQPQQLQQSIQQANQGRPNISWALSKDERKSYDNIFRTWDPNGTGFITGTTALNVFGQSGIPQDDLAKIWSAPPNPVR